MEWSARDAESHLDDLLDAVTADGPQAIRRRGKRFLVWAVIESTSEAPRNPVVDLLRSADWSDVEFTRIEGDMRDLDLS